MVEPTHLDRSRGSLLGLAIGDALGAPLEGLSLQQIRSHYGQVSNYVDGSKAWKKKPYRWRYPGLYSDDTQQALVLADVLIASGRVEAERVAGIYLELATPEQPFLGAHRGVGRSFRQVVQDLKRGVHPDDCGQESAGIGAAMRIAPVGVALGDDADAMFDSVMAASLMTHRDFRSLSGAMAVAIAVRRLMSGEAREPSFALWLAADVARAERQIAERFAHKVVGLPQHLHSLSRAIANVESLVDVPRCRALPALVDEANCHGAEPECRRPTMGFPPACIPTCIYFLLTTDCFEDAVIEIVNQGGDADTAGAILGAMAGAHYGHAGIPDRWLHGLQNRDGIEARANALEGVPLSELTIPSLVETERRLSELESQRRDEILVALQKEGEIDAKRRF